MVRFLISNCSHVEINQITCLLITSGADLWVKTVQKELVEPSQAPKDIPTLESGKMCKAAGLLFH